jgi:hypothetical protein
MSASAVSTQDPATRARTRRKRRSPAFMSRVYDLMDCGFTFIEAVKHAVATSEEYAEGERLKAYEHTRRKNQLATWNATVPVGTPVMYRFSVHTEERPSRTRSAAWMPTSRGEPYGSPMVLLEGVSGGYDLDFVRPLPAQGVAPATEEPSAAAPLQEQGP